MSIILNSAVDLLRSTNWCSVDLDKHTKFQNLTSSTRTKKSLAFDEFRRQNSNYLRWSDKAN